MAGTVYAQQPLNLRRPEAGGRRLAGLAPSAQMPIRPFLIFGKRRVFSRFVPILSQHVGIPGQTVGVPFFGGRTFCSDRCLALHIDALHVGPHGFGGGLGIEFRVPRWGPCYSLALAFPRQTGWTIYCYYLPTKQINGANRN